jgi:hypothetical protein
MNRKTRLLILAVITLLVTLAPATVLAQEISGGEEGLLLRVNGPFTISAQDRIDNVIVINDDAVVDGTVTGTLFVINGNAVVSGRVDQDVTVVNGTLTLEPGSTVKNVAIVRGTLVRDTGATITGSISETERFGIDPRAWGIFWAFMWFGTTIAILAAGLVFAAVGGRQLKAAGDTMTGNVGPSLLGVVVAWMLLPVLMVFAVFTVVGIPVGIGYFLFILPVVWFLGYLVAGTQLGRMILRSQRDVRNPYLAAILGLLILQIIGLFPVFGGLIAFVAGVVGSGALVVMGWRAWRGPNAEPTPPQQVRQVIAPAPGD